MEKLSLKLIPPFQVLIIGGAMWAIHRYIPIFHYHTGVEYYLSRAVLIAALTLFVAAVYQFWKHQTTVNPTKLENTTALITKGVFAWSRNPIYVVDVLLLYAWAIWLGNWINMFLPVLFVYFITELQIKPEEHMLMKKFGDQYLRYKQRVRRWV